MQIPLIKGSFTQHEAMDLLSKMIEAKIRFHENKISSEASEEDIKYRENRIKDLQTELAGIRQKLNGGARKINLNCAIEIGE